MSHKGVYCHPVHLGKSSPCEFTLFGKCNCITRENLPDHYTCPYSAFQETLKHLCFSGRWASLQAFEKRNLKNIAHCRPQTQELRSAHTHSSASLAAQRVNVRVSQAAISTRHSISQSSHCMGVSCDQSHG